MIVVVGFAFAGQVICMCVLMLTARCFWMHSRLQISFHRPQWLADFAGPRKWFIRHRHTAEHVCQVSLADWYRNPTSSCLPEDVCYSSKVEALCFSGTEYC